MSTLVESLKRLYKQGKVSAEKIREMVDKGVITEEEYGYITA